MVSVHHVGDRQTGGELSRFRHEFYDCLPRRTDALFELADAVLCSDGPVRSIAELSLVGEHRRSHGSGYAALARGRIDIDKLRTVLTAVSLPRAADGRLLLAVDITSWLRPEAHTCPQRILCHTHGRGKNTHIMVPGWPYSVIVALETARSSWTAPLDAVRLVPGDDAASVTARQVRGVVERLIVAEHWQPGDRDILLVADAGYDGPGCPICWPTCRSVCWCGCALTVCCVGRVRRERRRWQAARGDTAASSSSVTPRPGRTRCQCSCPDRALRTGMGSVLGPATSPLDTSHRLGRAYREAAHS